MYIGFSKSLGRGVRVGTAFKVGNRGRSSSQSSSAATRSDKNVDFARMCRQRAGAAFWQYSISHGICVGESPDDLERAAAEINEDLMSKIKPHMDVFTRIMNLYADSGSIRQESKEKLLTAVYEIEQILGENQGTSDLLPALRVWSEMKSQIWWVVLGIVLLGATYGVGTVILYFWYKKYKQPERDSIKNRARSAIKIQITAPEKVVEELRKK